MNRLFLGCAGLALLATTAAQAIPGGTVSGTVYVTGFVNAKCLVVDGESTSTSFSDTIALGQLDGVDGKISSSLTGSSIAGASKSFTVVCNSNAPTVSLSATAMGDGVTPDSGYTSTVDYTAKLDLVTTGSPASYTYATYPGGADAGGALSNALAGSANNVTVSVNSLNTDHGANSSILTAGSYGTDLGGTGGVITVTITP